ncbi:hypothetical protein K2X33_05490 [bacterium]|nr:hypothetical protein [bacterium]
MNIRSAVSKIQKRGILLVYPLQNRPEPRSLWSEFFPRSKMRWEWDSEGDDRVADLWHLKTGLSGSGKTVYAKWFQGRATFFSKELFPKLLCALGGSEAQLSPAARRILRVLEEDSPLSTKELRRRSGHGTKADERAYEKALKELWGPLFIVGYGEVEDGAFPSLAIGATSLLFDDLWAEAQKLDPQECAAELAKTLGEENPFYRHFLKVKKATSAAPAPKARVSRATKGSVGGTLRYEDLIGRR